MFLRAGVACCLGLVCHVSELTQVTFNRTNESLTLRNHVVQVLSTVTNLPSDFNNSLKPPLSILK